MNLAMPFTPKDLKRRYRELAKRHHPDRNPHKPGVAETMAAINQAAEVLTGVDATKLEQGIGITVGIQFGTSELYACDSVYAASFAAGSDAVYLASYSGRVVLGRPQRARPAGLRHRKRPDSDHRPGDYLYLLTGTRLYVLRDNALCAAGRHLREGYTRSRPDRLRTPP